MGKAWNCCAPMFYESSIVQQGARANFSPFIGKAAVDRTFALMQFAIRSLTALGNEMFRFTGKTKGGLILMIVFFYTAFVFGAALWVETGHTLRACRTLGSCTYTMMRLTFYDGTGFDYAYDLSSHGHKFLFILVMIYLCVTSFGILNGLVGLFGTAFNEASMMAFEGGATGGVGTVDGQAFSSAQKTADPVGSGGDDAVASGGDADVESHADSVSEPWSTLTPDDLARYRQITGKDFDADVNDSSSLDGRQTKLTGKAAANGASAYGGGLFGQFNRKQSQQQQRPMHENGVSQTDLAAVLAVMESRFRSQHEDIVHMLLLQTRMQLEISRLCEASGLEADPMFRDTLSGKMLPVKPKKSVHSPAVLREAQQQQHEEDSAVHQNSTQPAESTVHSEN
eukprot:gene47181-58882_t